MNCPRCETLIDDHEAIRCLDAWVAEEVMDRKLAIKNGNWWMEDAEINAAFCKLPKYSTSIEAAWEVLMKLHQQDWGYSVSFRSVMLCHESWIASSVAQSRPVIEEKGDIELAICRAAIKAKGNEDDIS